jgi:hypothetical protein
MPRYYLLEVLVYERQKIFLEEAEQRHLEKMPVVQPHAKHGQFHPIVHWIGAHLVRWGLQLQGEERPLSHLQPAQPTLG